MRSRNTVILIVLAAALAGYYFLLERPRQREEARREAAETHLADFDAGDAARLIVERPSDTLEFTRREPAGKWLMVRPVADRAEDGMVNRLLGVISESEIARDLGPQADLSPFGLEEPAATITVVTFEGDTVVHLDVGDLTVEKYHAYARRHRAGAGILLIPTGVRRYSQGEPFTFRSRRMLDVESGAVRAFTVTWPDSAMTWRRDAGGGWFTVVDGDTVRGYKPVLDEMVRRIRAISADEFVPESEVVVVRPFDAPPRSITVRKDDGAGHTVRIGRRLDGRVYAGAVPYDGAPERVVLTDTTVLDLFHQSVFDLRDRRVLSFDPDALGRLEFESPDFGVTLVRPGTEWTFPNPAAEPPAQQAVTRVLDALDALEYGRILENTPAVGSYDLSNASIRITIYDRDGRLVDRVLCAGAGSESGPYKVTSRHSGVIAELPREDVETLIFGFKQLRQP